MNKKEVARMAMGISKKLAKEKDSKKAIYLSGQLTALRFCLGLPPVKSTSPALSVPGYLFLKEKTYAN